jgi:Tol biopolymer transport system component
VVFISDEMLWRDAIAAVRFKDGKALGETIPIMNDVAAVEALATAFFVVNGNTIVTRAYGREPRRRFVWLTRGGEQTSLPFPERSYQDARISPDGRSIAVLVRSEPENVWIGDIARGVLDTFAPQVTNAGGPVWGPDGRTLAFAGLYRGTSGMVRVPVDNPGAIETLSSVVAKPTSWRGNTIAVEQLSMLTRTDVAVMPASPNAALRSIATTPAPEQRGSLSPDAAWIAYQSTDDIYVQRVEGAMRPVRVSPDGGETPVWSPDGATLFYQHGSSIMAASFSNGDVGQPHQVADAGQGRLQDISPDGQKFLLLITVSDDPRNQAFTVTIGWLADLLARHRTR